MLIARLSQMGIFFFVSMTIFDVAFCKFDSGLLLMHIFELQHINNRCSFSLSKPQEVVNSLGFS